MRGSEPTARHSSRRPAGRQESQARQLEHALTSRRACPLENLHTGHEHTTAHARSHACPCRISTRSAFFALHIADSQPPASPMSEKNAKFASSEEKYNQNPQSKFALPARKIILAWVKRCHTGTTTLDSTKSLIDSITTLDGGRDSTRLDCPSDRAISPIAQTVTGVVSESRLRRVLPRSSGKQRAS